VSDVLKAKVPAVARQEPMVAERVEHRAGPALIAVAGRLPLAIRGGLPVAKRHGQSRGHDGGGG